MIRLATAAVIVAAGLAVAAPALADSGRTEYMPCGTEDSVNCVWDAQHMGNGAGQSFFAGRDGKVYALPHHIAHFLITGEGRTEYMPCAQEGENSCVWDAAHMGNGIGRSYFAGREGRIYPLPHHIAHALVFGGAR